MKLVNSAIIGLTITFTSAISTAGEALSLSKCLELAPVGEQFSINLNMHVDTNQDPISKSGNLGVRNEKGPEVSEDQKRKFKPMVECLAALLDS